MDIDDVAAAHCLAMVQPEAHGRYVLWERACLMTEVAAVLRCAVVRAALWLGSLCRCHSELPMAAAAICAMHLLPCMAQTRSHSCSSAHPFCAAGRSSLPTGCRRCPPRSGCRSPSSSCPAPSSERWAAAAAASSKGGRLNLLPHVCQAAALPVEVQGGSRMVQPWQLKTWCSPLSAAAATDGSSACGSARRGSTPAVLSRSWGWGSSSRCARWA